MSLGRISLIKLFQVHFSNVPRIENTESDYDSGSQRC